MILCNSLSFWKPLSVHRCSHSGTFTGTSVVPLLVFPIFLVKWQHRKYAVESDHGPPTSAETVANDEVCPQRSSLRLEGPWEGRKTSFSSTEEGFSAEVVGHLLAQPVPANVPRDHEKRRACLREQGRLWTFLEKVAKIDLSTFTAGVATLSAQSFPFLDWMTPKGLILLHIRDTF